MLKSYGANLYNKNSWFRAFVCFENQEDVNIIKNPFPKIIIKKN